MDYIYLIHFGGSKYTLQFQLINIVQKCLKPFYFIINFKLNEVRLDIRSMSLLHLHICTIYIRNELILIFYLYLQYNYSCQYCILKIDIDVLYIYHIIINMIDDDYISFTYILSIL